MTSTTLRVTIELELDVRGTIEPAQPSVGRGREVGDWVIEAIRIPDSTNREVIPMHPAIGYAVASQCRDQIEEALLDADA